MGPVSSLPSFTIQNVTFPLIKGGPVPPSKRLEEILYSYEPYYSGTGPNGVDPQTYAGSFGGLQPEWGNAWKYKIDLVIGTFRSRLYSAKNEWDVEREARFAVNEIMRMLTAKGQSQPFVATSTPRAPAPTPITPIVVTTTKPITPPPASFVLRTTPKPPLVVVATAKNNSKKAIKYTPKKGTTTKQSSPGKGTPNKNPVIPPPPPPPPPSPPLFPPDKIMQRPCPMCVALLEDPSGRTKCPPCEPCPPGWYVGPVGECLKCALKGYVNGSHCSPCPPGTTGESIHTGCSQIGPDGNTYTFIA